jgi:hypothetical protein
MGGGCHQLLFLAVGLGRPSICPVFAGIASANVGDFIIVQLFGMTGAVLVARWLWRAGLPS